MDDPDFRYKNKDRWDCNGYIKGRNKNKLANKCHKFWKGERVYDHCPDRCGRKAGVGPCAYLFGQKKVKPKKTSNTSNKNTVEEAVGFVKPQYHTASTEHVAHSNTNIFSSSNRATEAIATTTTGGGGTISSNSRGQVYNKNDTWLNFNNKRNWHNN